MRAVGVAVGVGGVVLHGQGKFPLFLPGLSNQRLWQLSPPRPPPYVQGPDQVGPWCDCILDQVLYIFKGMIKDTITPW